MNRSKLELNSASITQQVPLLPPLQRQVNVSAFWKPLMRGSFFHEIANMNSNLDHDGAISIDRAQTLYALDNHTDKVLFTMNANHTNAMKMMLDYPIFIVARITLVLFILRYHSF